jgi:putative Mg2+ transporter-C (MgtC) family protein
VGELSARLAHDLRLELLVQLVLAVFLGGAIGVERELKGKPAGLRTNVLICVGATLYTVLSAHMAGHGQGDTTRIAGQIITGVGFIGAGTILHTRGAVTGLTSAATIWVVAAIGMALGSGAYVEALGTSALVMVVLTGLAPIEALVAQRSSVTHLVLHARPSPETLDAIVTLVKRTGLELERSEARQENVDLVIELEVRGAKRLHDQLLIGLMHHPGIRSVSTGE